MVCSRFALRLLARADAPVTQEALIGDLLEEISTADPDGGCINS